MLADLAEAGAVTAALSSGCDGFVTATAGSTSSSPPSLPSAAERPCSRRPPRRCSPATIAIVIAIVRTGRSSRRELQIVAGLARGLTNRAIAEELYLSVHTVRNHIQRICRRLGASTRLEVVVIAAREGLVDLAAGA